MSRTSRALGAALVLIPVLAVLGYFANKELFGPDPAATMQQRYEQIPLGQQRDAVLHTFGKPKPDAELTAPPRTIGHGLECDTYPAPPPGGVGYIDFYQFCYRDSSLVYKAFTDNNGDGCTQRVTSLPAADLPPACQRPGTVPTPSHT